MVTEGRRTILWQRIHLWVAHVPVDSSPAVHMQATLVGFNWSLKRRGRRRDEVGRGNMLVGLEVGEKTEVDMIIFHYMHAWNSQRLNS